jgi:coenzyme F420-0:L-glutamate ligase/coenzyme F420-1:gamma-L-glutamate ligase
MTTSHAPDRLELIALLRFPMVRQGDRLPELIGRAAADNGLRFCDDDVLVVAQKVVSKAEGRLRRLADVVPSGEALLIAGETGKDPRLVELILEESTGILRRRDNLIIAESRLGLVMANAGIDRSNVEDECALLLPVDPDRSAGEIRAYLKETAQADVGVIIIDSIGRAWRNGIIGHAIGVAGLEPLLDLRGTPDLNGRELQVTEVAVADEIAAAGSLLMGQAAEGKPVVLVRGLKGLQGQAGARALVRSRERDLFR